MQREAFERWLSEEKQYQETTIKTRSGNCSTIEYYEGDLDDLYDTDRCDALLESMKYSKEDQEVGRPPKHHIPITGDVYNGTATLKNALKLYIRFRGGEQTKKMSNIDKKEKTQSAIKSQKRKDSAVAVYFDYKATSEQINILKKIIADTVIFFPPSVFESYVQSNITSERLIQREWPYLIFSKRKDGLRMRRGKAASEIKRTQIENPDDRSEMIFLTDNANGRFNTEYGNAFEKIYGKKIPAERYSICHIGGNTAYDVKTFSAIPNVVYAPTWIERVTDDSPEIRRLLATRSYELYGTLIKEALMKSGKSEIEADEQIKYLYLAMQSPREGLTQEVEAVFPPEYQDKNDEKLAWRDWTK